MWESHFLRCVDIHEHRGEGLAKGEGRKKKDALWEEQQALVQKLMDMYLINDDATIFFSKKFFQG